MGELKMAPEEQRRIIRFLFVGILNTAFGYAVFVLLVVAGLSSAFALLLTTVIGVCFNFFTTGQVVFQNRQFRVLPRFVGAYAFTYVFNLGLLKSFESLGPGPILAQALSLPPTVLLSFVILKTFVFRSGLRQ